MPRYFIINLMYLKAYHSTLPLPASPSGFPPMSTVPHRKLRRSLETLNIMFDLSFLFPDNSALTE